MDRNTRIPSDCRTARYTKAARACHTSWGPFPSVKLAVEHVMKYDVEFAAPFIIRAADAMDGAPHAEVLKRAMRNAYSTVYQRCVVGTIGGYGDFRFT